MSKQLKITVKEINQLLATVELRDITLLACERTPTSALKAKSEGLVVLAKARREELANRFEPAFRQVNGKAGSFTLGALDAVSAILVIEQKLEDAGIPKTLRAGCGLVDASAGPNSRSYGYASVGTRYSLSRTGSAWVLESVQRITVYPNQRGGLKLVVTAAAADRLRENALDGIVELPRAVAVAA